MALSPEALAALEENNPELVAQYRAKMSQADQNVEEAKDYRTYGGIANSLGKAATDYSNASGPAPVILHNRMDALGAAPKTHANAQQEYDGSALTKSLDRGVDEARADRVTAGQDFQAEQHLQDLGTKRVDAQLVHARTAKSMDPTSAESQAARDYLKMVGGADVGNIKNFDNLTEEQAHQLAPGLMHKQDLQDKLSARQEESRQRTADRGAMLGARSADKADARAEADQRYQDSVRIPDTSVQPGYRPTVQGAAKVRDAKTAHDELQGAVGQLDRLYAKSGTNMIGDDSNEQAQIVNSMKTKLKDLEKLGALSAGDYALLAAQIPDPTSLSENVKGVFGGDSYAVKSKAFKEGLTRSLNATARNNGYTVNAPPADAAGNSKPGWAK